MQSKVAISVVMLAILTVSGVSGAATSNEQVDELVRSSPFGSGPVTAPMGGPGGPAGTVYDVVMDAKCGTWGGSTYYCSPYDFATTRGDYDCSKSANRDPGEAMARANYRAACYGAANVGERVYLSQGTHVLEAQVEQDWFKYSHNYGYASVAILFCAVEVGEPGGCVTMKRHASYDNDEYANEGWAYLEKTLSLTMDKSGYADIWVEVLVVDYGTKEYECTKGTTWKCNDVGAQVTLEHLVIA